MRLLVGALLLGTLLDARLGWLRRLLSPGSAPIDEDTAEARSAHPQHEFHVAANTIRIEFAVPLPTEGIDDVLRDLLLHHSLEIIRDRKRRGQPLQGIKKAYVFAQQDETDVEVGTLELTQREEIPEIEKPMLVPLGASPQEDPLRKLGDLDVKKVVSLAETTELDKLRPVGGDLQLTAGLAAGLRARGVDPTQMSASELGLGLLEISGYRLTKQSEDTYLAAGGGLTTFVRFVDHEIGSYPELEGSDITEFLVGFTGAHTDRALLITDKYGPYEIYAKERANPRCHFITRERMQAFVDSIALS